MGNVPYRELPPPPDLAHIVRCLWLREGSGGESPILPDGCLDVIVRDGRALVAGPDTAPVPVAVRPGELVAGVRMHPGAGGAALGVPADELRDRRVALEDLWGAAGRETGERAGYDPLALADALRDRLAAAAPDPRVLGAVRRLARAPATPVPALAAAVEARRAPAAAPLRRRGRLRPEDARAGRALPPRAGADARRGSRPPPLRSPPATPTRRT